MMFLFTMGHGLLQANEEWKDWNNDDREMIYRIFGLEI